MKFSARIALAVLAVLAVALFIPACAIVPPNQQNVIAQNAANAHAYNKKIQASPDAPSGGPVAADVKQWINAEDKKWTYMDDWAHNRTPAATQP